MAVALLPWLGILATLIALVFLVIKWIPEKKFPRDQAIVAASLAVFTCLFFGLWRFGQ